MISVQQAIHIINNQVRDFGVETVPLKNAIGRILREDIVADRDFPPFDRVTMDGIALQHASFENGQHTFPITGVAAAGHPEASLKDPKSCLEVMTGAMLPRHTDVVIRYEDLTITNGSAKVNLEELILRKNIHAKGSDRKQGDVLLKKGCKIGPAEVAVAATVGKATILVSQLPSIMIISTGDELVDIDTSPLPHQIRSSNKEMLRSGLYELGIQAKSTHLVDDYEKVKTALVTLMEENDVLILSGGVSMGKFDYIPKAFEALGVEKLFHKIAQRPGKPLWFGKAKNGCVIFALPGNPVSSFVGLNKYVLPWLKRCLQRNVEKPLLAKLSAPVTFKPPLRFFIQVKLFQDETGQLLAIPINGNGSGDLANLVDVDAFMELPETKEQFLEGECYELIKYRVL